MRLIAVAVPVPTLDALTYSVPESLPMPLIGARVLVPLGNRTLTGIVVDVPDAVRVQDAASESGGLPPEGGSYQGRKEDSGGAGSSVKDVIEVLDDSAFLPADVVRLASWVANYYASGAGEAMATAMPPRAWVESERYAQITEAGEARLLTERGARRRVLEALSGAKPVRMDALIGKGSHTASVRRAGPAGNSRSAVNVAEKLIESHPRGSHAVLIGLERDGLVRITQPLKGSADAHRSARVVTLTAQGHDAIESDASSARVGAPAAPSDEVNHIRLGPRQREALGLLKAAPEGIDATALDQRGIGASTIKRLAELGLVSMSRRRIERDPAGHGVLPSTVAREPHVFTDEQAAAFERLNALATSGAFSTVLLHGVTGSGKTELYLRLADAVHRSGRAVLMLVPEIALTPAVAGVFRATFGERVAIQHSGLSDGERHDQWQRIRRGDVDVVVGTRSAIFAPLRSLGLIIVDEEHDGSYKQEESPRYHGRDVAVVRGSHAGALVVLGSATPSLESFHNAELGRYSLITLERRVLDRPMASVRIVDMRAEYAESGPDVILSGPLCEALTDRLQKREQSIVLLNRRGFASAVFCRQCASTLECPNCSVSLTVHRSAGRARCHYCNHSTAIPKVCANCAGPYLEQIGFGTERVEAEIVAHFPDARVARVDRDTVRKRGAIAALLARFGAGEIDVLVGTQMIAKGHDFPRVTLVGVISADVGLGLADFRAAERTFQLLTQVAGRAGRGLVSGEAIVQTLYPRHYSIRHACRQDYGAFYKEEITFRRGMRYPPAVAMINAVVKARTRQEAMDDAGEIVKALRFGGEPYSVLGPAPAPLNRLKGEHRAQFFIKGSHRPTMRQALQTVLSTRPEIRRRTIVDVDPVSVL
jgi:primosomal protein N' (replication factor Y) (superfamily II helicase)